VTLENILLSALAGTAILLLVLATAPAALPELRQLRMRQAGRLQRGIQVRLDRAQLDVSANDFLLRGTASAGGLALFALAVVGSVALVPVAVFAGFLLTWTQLEQKRDRRIADYNRTLASACDTLRNAYLTTGSLMNAMRAVVDYGRAPVREDFLYVLTAARQGDMRQGLQDIADRRRSIVFDAVANAMLRAEESSGAVGEMLERLAESTRQNVAAFETASIQQINGRSNANWGAFGPWLVFGVVRLFTAGGAIVGFGIDAAAAPDFFTTPAGNAVAALAGIITILLHRWCFQIAQRGLTVPRITTQPSGSPDPVQPGRRIVIGMDAQMTARMRQKPLGS
jgi:Flp pilus assembly protein TadB